MHINPNKALANSIVVKTTKQVITCEATGVSMELDIPRLVGANQPVLTWTSPWAYWSNVAALVQQPIEWLDKQDRALVQGWLIVALRHYELLCSPLTAQEIQALLHSANKDKITRLVYLIGHAAKQPKLAKGIPQLTLEWDEVKGFKDCNMLLEAYATRISKYLDPEERRKEALAASKQQAQDERFRPGRKLAGGYMLSSLEVQKNKQTEAEEGFAAARKELKRLLKDAEARLEGRMYRFLHDLLPGRNLAMLNSELRARLAVKLEDAGEPAIAEALVKAIQPYDILATSVAELDRASDSMSKSITKPKTLAEILAAKRAAAGQPQQGVAEQAPVADGSDL